LRAWFSSVASPDLRGVRAVSLANAAQASGLIMTIKSLGCPGTVPEAYLEIVQVLFTLTL